MKKYFLGVLLLSFLVLTSCNRDKENPVITITSPAADISVDPGDSFVLRATVTDNDALESISISGGGINQFVTEFDQIDTHSINFEITINEDSDPGDFIMTITAQDISDNRANEDFTVTIN